MIDAHVHFWRYARSTHGWIDEQMDVLKRDFLPRDLEPLLRANGFDGCIAVQAAQTLDETRFLLHLAEQHAFIRGVVGWVDLRSADIDAQMEEFATHQRLVGMRHIAQDEPDDGFLARADVKRGIAKLARFDLAYEVLVYARQLPAVIDLCQSLPNQRFVLDHCGKPEIRSRKREPWATHIAELARCDNVACKLSGLVTEADWKSWTRDDLAFYVDRTIEAFGPERLMIGSDWPVCTLAAQYSDVIASTRGRLDALSPSEQLRVRRGTAEDWYRLANPVRKSKPA